MAKRKHAETAAERIATYTLGLPTLQTRKMDDLDFHELAVWSIKDALVQAFETGYDTGMLARHQWERAAEDLMQAIEELGFLNTRPTTRKEKDAQIEQMHRWYTQRLRPALARLQAARKD